MRFEDTDGVRVSRVRGAWTSDNIRALISAAVRGVGLMRMTDYYMEEELKAGELDLVGDICFERLEQMVDLAAALEI